MRGIPICYSKMLFSMRATPHLCGEYLLHTFQLRLSFGATPTRAGNTNRELHQQSSIAEPPPLVRGILISTFYTELLDGATPTCAGNTGFQTATSAFEKSHPHLCGEYTRQILIYHHLALKNCSISITLVLNYR